MNPTRPRQSLAAAAALTLILGVAACGDDDDSGASPPIDAADAGAGIGDEAAGAATGETIEVELRDFEFAGLPESVPVGTKLTVVNTSPHELHEIVVFRLADDEDRSLDELLALPDEEADELFVGMPEMVLVAAPGGDQIDVHGNGVLSTAGRFIVLCGIPTGADPEAYLAAAEGGDDGPPEVAGGPPHFMNGMVAELRVTD